MTVHLVKMAVGVRDTSHLAEIQAERLKQALQRGEDAGLRHITRHMPKRTKELLDGGSIFWVIKGFIRVRQLILGAERTEDAQSRPSCALILDPRLVRVELRAFKPFQGWRYLETEAAPPDNRRPDDDSGDMPEKLAAELRELGLL